MIAQIETTTFCNYKCWYCQNAHYNNPKSQVMPMELFKAILKEISAVFPKDRLKTISFAAYNEPTLDPFFKDRLRELTRHGFEYWFLTNGSGIDADLVDFITREKPSINCFHINLPAIDPTEYQQATTVPGESIYKIRETLAFLFENREKIGARMNITVHGKGDDTHKRNFIRMKEFWKHHPVEVVFQKVMNRAGMLSHIIGPPIDHGTDKVWCTARYFENLYIGVKGNLYLCCHDYYQKYSYGIIPDESLKISLTAKKRSNMIRKFTHDFCRHCTFAIKFEEIQINPQKVAINKEMR